MPERHRLLAVLGGLLVGAAVAVLLSLRVGDLQVGFADVLNALFRPGEGQASTVIRELRLPRALAAFACGGLLATAGALM